MFSRFTVSALIFLLVPIFAFSQNNKLTITGSVSCEKSEVASVRMVLVEMLNETPNTVQIKNLTPDKHFNSGKFSIELELNKNYKLIFAGDTAYQETRYFDVSTKINSNAKSKKYSLNEVFVDIWIMDRLKKEGEIFFDDSIKNFRVVRNK